MSCLSHDFGGDWTEEKLERVKKYLQAYMRIMHKRKGLRCAYVDAFAGTGYRTLEHAELPGELLFPELAEPEPQTFLQGSARIALQVQPRFDKYIFVEKHAHRFQELVRLREEFPDLANDIVLINADANTYLQDDLCASNKNWDRHRAVLFLDPYGMQVRWRTLEVIAATQAIDLWLLFPIGAVNRLLRRDGQIDEVLQARLNEVFGTTDWYDAFYHHDPSLFDAEAPVRKVASFERIRDYFVERLQTIFPFVAPNPLMLCSSRNVPLFVLCFAAGNPRAPAALRIAQEILGR